VGTTRRQQFNHFLIGVVNTLNPHFGFPKINKSERWRGPGGFLLFSPKPFFKGRPRKGGGVGEVGGGAALRGGARLFIFFNFFNRKKKFPRGDGLPPQPKKNGPKNKGQGGGGGAGWNNPLGRNKGGTKGRGGGPFFVGPKKGGGGGRGFLQRKGHKGGGGGGNPAFGFAIFSFGGP